VSFKRKVEAVVKQQKSKAKQHKKIRFFFYCRWACALRKLNVGPKDATYTFPPIVLEFLRELLPVDITGEVRDGTYKLTLKEFSRVM
jgi:hypothetical protein